jgi:hypothetical protein
MRTSIVSILVFALSASLAGQQPRSETHNSSAVAGDPVAQVLAFERDMEAAVVRGDVAYLEKICAKDFSFTHGDGWTSGGAPLRVENREQWLASVGKAPYLYRNLGSVKVEMHGDIAITYGMYKAQNKTAKNGFTVWFERVYAFRNGAWQYVSHRTVHGPINDTQ